MTMAEQLAQALQEMRNMISETWPGCVRPELAKADAALERWTKEKSCEPPRDRR